MTYEIPSFNYYDKVHKLSWINIMIILFSCGLPSDRVTPRKHLCHSKTPVSETAGEARRYAVNAFASAWSKGVSHYAKMARDPRIGAWFTLLS